MSYSRKVTIISSSESGNRIVTTTHKTFSSSGWVEFSSEQEQPMVFSQTVEEISTPSSSCSDNSDDYSNSQYGSSSFEEAVLEEHNRLRAKHSAEPLTLDPAINHHAQEWANIIASRNVMQHRPQNRYGENLYACFGKTDIQGEDAVISWYNEIEDYCFGQPNPPNFSKVGHFTQLVWKNSERLGVGIARNGNNVYVVCNYDPPGNYSGQYPANVTPN